MGWLLMFMTIKDVASHLGVSWDTIRDIRKRLRGSGGGRREMLTGTSMEASLTVF